MAKFEDIEKAFFSVLDSAAWKAENIPSFPSNFIVTTSPKEYIRVSVLAAGRGVNLKSVAGQLLVDVFIAAGSGTTRAQLIADILDRHFSCKTFGSASASTQTFESSFVPRDDAQRDSYGRFRYSLSFLHSGVG